MPGTIVPCSREHTGAYLYTSGVRLLKPLPRFTPGVNGNTPVEEEGDRVIITNQEPDPMHVDLPENRYIFRFLPAPRA